MTKTILLFGICLAILLAVLKWVEYLFFTKDLALEVYVGIVAAFFTFLGGWIGWNLTRPKKNQENVGGTTHETLLNKDFIEANNFNLSPRELEVLELIAKGMSYQEIADQLSVSLSTIKTHASNIFSKMDVQRRTQAVMLAQKTGLIHPTKG